MLITVIVPIYNMEAYLCTSLDRLLHQSFQDYEILLIDDGSKDSSGEICDRYAREHSRIRVVHKPNGGLSTARNAGIEHARGEYLTFCDCGLSWCKGKCRESVFSSTLRMILLQDFNISQKLKDTIKS